MTLAEMGEAEGRSLNAIRARIRRGRPPLQKLMEMAKFIGDHNDDH